MVKTAWLIPVCSPQRAYLQKWGPSGSQGLAHRTAGQAQFMEGYSASRCTASAP